MNKLYENMIRFGTKNLSEQSISNLPTNNPTPIDLNKVNLGRDLKRAGYKIIDNKGKDLSLNIKDIKNIAKTNLLMIFSSKPNRSMPEAIRQAFAAKNISYYQPNADVNGLVPIFKIHRDDPNVPNKPGTLTISSQAFDDILVLKEENGEYQVLFIRPYEAIKSKYDPMKDSESPEYKAKYDKSNDDDFDLNPDSMF